MKPNPFNICPGCSYRTTCVITDQKELVWSCSEYEEEDLSISDSKDTNPEIGCEKQPELTLA